MLLWLVWDLVNGRTLAHRWLERRREPLLYWSGMLLWTVVALVFYDKMGTT